LLVPTKKTTRDEYLKQSFVLQHQINEKHETLRETLLTARKRSGRSHEEKATINTPPLLISSIDRSKTFYKMIDAIFGAKNS
jgi:hypothetical protein